MPARPRTADAHQVQAALVRLAYAVGDDRTAPTPSSKPDPDDLRLLVKHFLAVLAQQAPGRSVEIRVPPYAAAQAVPGPQHTRGTPPGVVEADPLTWIELSVGWLDWQQAVTTGRVLASGERSNLAAYLPLTRRG